MKFVIRAIGQLKQCPEQALVQRYLSRLSNLKVIECSALPLLPVDERKKQETDALLRGIPRDDLLFVCDERGKTLTSHQFSTFLEEAAVQGKSQAHFLIGGADGLDKTLLPSHATLLAFGGMTWPHALVRAMVAEQIYRAVQLLKNHPYHRD